MTEMMSQAIKRNKSQIILSVVLVLFVFIRIIIQLKIPPITLAGVGVDEHVFVLQATAFIKGDWLGSYDFITLVKNPMFSFFYVFLNKFAIPYPLGLILLHILASLAVICSILPIIKNKYGRAAIFLFLLYTPVMMDKHFGFRLYRDALLTPLLLLIFASIIGLFLYRNKRKLFNFCWAVTAGFSFTVFFYLREDSVWLKPFFYIALISIALFLAFNKTTYKEKIIRVFFLLIPLLILQSTTVLLSRKNLQEYGIYTVNDHTQTYFRNVITDLISIDDGKNQENIWVYEDTLREAMNVSPTLNKLSEQIDWLYDPETQMTVVSKESGKPEIFGGNIVWNLRLAAARAEVAYRDKISVDGYLEKGGKATNEYFEQIHKELTDAFNSGRLNKRQSGISISKSAPAKSWTDIQNNVVPKMTYIIKENLLYTKFSTGLNEDSIDDVLHQVLGVSESVRQIEMLINFPLNYPLDSPEAQYNKPIAGTAKKIDTIINLYKWTSPIIIICAFIGIIYSCYSLLKKRFTDKNIITVLMTLGLLLSYFILIFGVSWAYSWVSDETLRRLYYYTSSAIPLLQIVYILGLISFADLLKKLDIKGALKKNKQIEL